MTKKIYGFAGRKRSGKGVLCNVIKENDKNVVILTIADYLKQMCCDILGIDLTLLNERKDNGYKYNIKPTNKWYNIIHNRTQIPIDIIINEISNITFIDVRHMLQIIGTDLIRKYNPEWHVEQLKNDILSYSDEFIITIDDVRFPNEVKTIEDLGGEVFYIIRPNFFDVSNHPSETALTWNNFDKKHIIINDLPLDLFKEYFRISYELHFCEHSINPLFLSNNTHFLYTANVSFPLNGPLNGIKHSIIDKLIEQNKNDIRFLKNGIIHFCAKNRKEATEFTTEVLNSECTTWQREFILYNPLLNENLKRYL